MTFVSTLVVGLVTIQPFIQVTAIVHAKPVKKSSTTTPGVTTTTKTGFQDVKAGYWAEKYIDKLVALDILKGNNGQFRPGAQVTQQEAVTIAIRYMGLDSDAQRTKTAGLPVEFQVNDYFKPYVSLALQKGLFDQKEKGVKLQPKKSWGLQKATREWVVKLLIRALGKQADADRVKGKATSFADNHKITPAVRGYVNVAMDLKLITGLKNNCFAPQDYVTRAQLATLFSRGETNSTIKRAAETSGYVMERTEQQIRLYTEERQIKLIPCHANTKYYQADDEQAIKAADVDLYTKVKVIEQADRAAYVEVIDKKVNIESLVVALKYVTMSEKKLYFTTNGSDVLSHIVYQPFTVFRDEEGKEIDVTKLSKDSDLLIKRETFSNERNVIEIQVKSGPIHKSGKATITAVDVKNRSLLLKTEQGNNETYTVAEDVLIRYKDQLLSDFSQLKAMDTVTFTVKNSVITAIERMNAQMITMTGILYEKGVLKTSITIRKDNQELVAKKLAADVKIEMAGLHQPTLEDIVAGEYGDRVEVTLNNEDAVTNIKIINRKAEFIFGATVTHYDKANQILKVIDEKKQNHIFLLTSETKFEHNGMNINLDDLSFQIKESKRKVNIQHIGQKALRIEVVHKIVGTFISVNPTAKTVTMKVTNGQLITLPYEGKIGGVEKYGTTRTTIADVKTGDTIVAYFSDDQSTVSSLALRHMVPFEIVTRYIDKSRLRVRNGTKVEEFYIGNATIFDLNNQRIGIKDLQDDNDVHIVFDGRSVAEIRQVEWTYGKVESIHTDTGIVRIRTNDGAVSTCQVDQATTIDLRTLRVGDRVEVYKDVNNKSVLQVSNGMKRSFWRHNSQTNELYVKRSLAENHYIFPLHPQVLIHANGEKISFASMKENSEIMVYMMRNQVVEIEKLPSS